MAYPHQWSPISCRSSAGQGNFASQRPTFYHCATPPTCRCCLLLYRCRSSAVCVFATRMRPTNTAEPIEMPFREVDSRKRKEPCVSWGPDPVMGRATLGIYIPGTRTLLGQMSRPGFAPAERNHATEAPRCSDAGCRYHFRNNLLILCWQENLRTGRGIESRR